ncbi:hypothetical protein HHK36_027493 [Tetracentron sinense]|uniref:PP2A regulatory subunit TAP46 n=1 Tax=Tetracentron sinense TaxID=13715 RepID=A0A834YEY3_TETSI|nr:hypothetical protein HHK36_027493 [Tetracentron sinense]
MSFHVIVILMGIHNASLQVPFYLAELTEKVSQDDRIQVLKVSQGKLKEFISFCEAMDLVPEEELETSVQEGPNSLQIKGLKNLSSTTLHGRSDTDFCTNNQKLTILAITDGRSPIVNIARFKCQRAAKSKLQDIKERKERRGRSSKAAALSTPIEAGAEDMMDDDGEEEWEAWLTTISLAICTAFDLLEMLKKEEEMLSDVKEKQLQEGDKEIAQAVLDERSKRAEDWHRDAAIKAQFTKPVQPITCAMFAQDVVEGRAKVSQAHEHKRQPLIFGPASLVCGRLTSERERMAAQVFQPGYRMPTMSIEEAGLCEMEVMKNWQERNAKLFEEANSSWHKDSQKLVPTGEEDDDEAAQEKARAWDNWKDDHPRGAGNKKLTPCG